jgi:hypothetical protein
MIEAVGRGLVLRSVPPFLDRMSCSLCQKNWNSRSLALQLDELEWKILEYLLHVFSSIFLLG